MRIEDNWIDITNAYVNFTNKNGREFNKKFAFKGFPTEVEIKKIVEENIDQIDRIHSIDIVDECLLSKK